MIIVSYLISLFGIGFLILIHEVGHFLFCKLFNIPAPKFAIGIGPKLFSKKYKKTEYSIGLIPIMGYVQIGEETNENESDVHVLYKHRWIKGTLVTFGGIILNLLFAYIAISSLIVWNSEHLVKTNLKSFIPQKNIVIEDKENNQIILNYHTPIEVLQKIKKGEFTLEDHEGEKIIFENEKFFTNNFIIKYDSVSIPDNFFDKITFGIIITNNIIKQSIYGIISLFKGANFSSISGPIGIIKNLGSAIEKGLTDFFIFLSLVSISLAVINLVPIPMLDGGQFLFLTIYKIIGKGVPESIQAILTYVSLGLIIIMTIFSTYNDILRVFFN
jgi:regulator of sigma E protease